MERNIRDHLKDGVPTRLNAFRDSRGWSISELARQIGMSAQATRVYTTGESVPGGEVLYKLASLGCDINWLLTGTEPAGDSVNVSDNNGTTITTRSGKVVIIAGDTMNVSAGTEALEKEIEYLKQRIEDLEKMMKMKDEMIEILRNK